MCLFISSRRRGKRKRKRKLCCPRFPKTALDFRKQPQIFEHVFEGCARLLLYSSLLRLFNFTSCFFSCWILLQRAILTFLLAQAERPSCNEQFLVIASTNTMMKSKLGQLPKLVQATVCFVQACLRNNQCHFDGTDDSDIVKQASVFIGGAREKLQLFQPEVLIIALAEVLTIVMEVPLMGHYNTTSVEKLQSFIGKENILSEILASGFGFF